MIKGIIFLIIAMVSVSKAYDADYIAPENHTQTYGTENWFYGQDPQSITAWTVVPKRSTIVVYRYASVDNFFEVRINGRLQGVLDKTGGYTVAALCAEKNVIAAVKYVKHPDSSSEVIQNNLVSVLKPDTISYFKVTTEINGNLKLTQVSAAEGQYAVNSLPRMTRIISRLPQRHCNAAPPPPPPF
jgi:hypothetical protein